MYKSLSLRTYSTRIGVIENNDRSIINSKTYDGTNLINLGIVKRGKDPLVLRNEKDVLMMMISGE